MRRVTVIASALGTRIDCDICGEHTTSPDLTLDQLRRATGYVRVDGRDYCPGCAPGGSAPPFAGRFVSGPSA
jgi:hypothetical protein